MRPPWSDEDLRHAFQSAADAARLDDVDLDLIWGAVSGALPAEERRAVVDRVSRDPSWAQAWRIASNLWRAYRAADTNAGRKSRPLYGVVAVAAVLVAAVLSPAILKRMGSERRPSASERGRSFDIESRVSQTATQPRSACFLRWSEPPEAVAYEVYVTSIAAGVAHRKAGLKSGEYQIPEAVLAPAGSPVKLMWRVSAKLRDGSVISSPTFFLTCN